MKAASPTKNEGEGSVDQIVHDINSSAPVLNAKRIPIPGGRMYYFSKVMYLYIYIEASESFYFLGLDAAKNKAFLNQK